jgi:hypothetical protein
MIEVKPPLSIGMVYKQWNLLTAVGVAVDVGVIVGATVGVTVFLKIQFGF